MTERVRNSWSLLTAAPWWPAVPILLVQLVSGIWYMPQLSFFPIYLEEQLGLAPVLISTLVSIGQVAGMVSGIVSGVLSDFLGSKWVLVLGLIGATVASVAFVTPFPALVAALWVVNGMAVGFHTLGGSSYLTKVATARYVGILSALYEFFLTLGGALGNPAAGLILDRMGFGTFGVIALTLIGATAMGTALLVPQLQQEGRAGHGAIRGSLEDWWGISKRPVVVVLILLRYLPTVYYGMAGVLVPILVNRMARSKTTVAIYASTSLIAASLAQLVAGRAVDRWGRKWPTIVAYGVLLVSGMGLAATVDQLGGIFAFGVVGNGSAWALSALMLCLVPEAVPAEEHGRVLGVQHAAWSLGMITGAMLGGALVKIATGLPFIAAALLNVGSIVLTLSFYRLVNRRDDVAGVAS